MRNFDQRMGEIKTRSHARIIRRRKQLTSMCAVFAVALCCGATFLLRQQPEQIVAGDPVSTTEALHVFTGSVTISHQNNRFVHTDAEVVEDFISLLGELPLAQSVAMETSKTYDHSLETTAVPISYTIELQTPDGEVASYRLFGKTLTNLDTEEVFSLSDKAQLELLRILGIYKH